MIADQIAHVSMLESAIPVRLRTFDHNGQPSVVATPAGTNGHLLNRRASWIATHACNMGTPTTMRFFTLYDIDAGEGRTRSAAFEFEFRWIGKIAIAIKSSRMIKPGELCQVIGESIDYLAEEVTPA